MESDEVISRWTIEMVLAAQSDVVAAAITDGRESFSAEQMMDAIYKRLNAL